MPIAQSTVNETFGTPHGKAAYHLVEKLTDAGFEAWWVGGCVRDMLLGQISEDIDIGTNAKPDEIKKILAVTDVSAELFGSLRVKEQGHTFEVTTFREDDSMSDGRHPESVMFSTRENDAARRDITVNAMYWHPISSELYDPFGGEGDLKERLIKIIGDPDIRIAHDALRLLRVVRFRALLDGQYHPATFQALHRNAKKIGVLSGARRLEELEKMLLGPRPACAFEDLWETDILETLVPELHTMKGVAQPNDYHREGDVWEHTMACLSAFTEEHQGDVRLAALFHDSGKATTFDRKERIRFDEHASVSADLTKIALDRLQCPAKRREKICWLIRHHMMMSTFFDARMEEKRKAHWFYHPWFNELLELFWIDIAGTDPADFRIYESLEKQYHHFLDAHPKPPKPLLTGEDVMHIAGICPGERVGEILAILYEKQLRKEIRTKEDAREFLATL